MYIHISAIFVGKVVSNLSKLSYELPPRRNRCMKDAPQIFIQTYSCVKKTQFKLTSS